MSSLINPNFPVEALNLPNWDRKNVIDHYKFVSTEIIKGDLEKKRTKLVIIAENWLYDFNLATLIRNSNAFTAKCVHVIGRRQFDKRGTVGTYKYENIFYHENLYPLIEELKQDSYRIVAIDNLDGASSVVDYQWQEKTALIFGQEAVGVSPMALEVADDVVYIPQLGSVRSLNVGTASGIVMYDYLLKSKKLC